MEFMQGTDPGEPLFQRTFGAGLDRRPRAIKVPIDLDEAISSDVGQDLDEDTELALQSSYDTESLGSVGDVAGIESEGVEK